MAITYNGSVVNHLKYNNDYCHQVNKDGTVVWAEKVGTLYTPNRTGLASQSIYRSSTIEPSASIGTLKATAPIYYGDTLSVAFTASTYWTVSPQSINVKVPDSSYLPTFSSPTEISISFSNIPTLTRNSRTVSFYKNKSLPDSSFSANLWGYSISYTNTSGSITTSTIYTQSTTAYTLPSVWQGSKIVVNGAFVQTGSRTTTVSTYVPGYTFTASSSSLTITPSLYSIGTNPYYSTASTVRFTNSSTLSRVFFSALASDAAYQKVYLNAKGSTSTTNKAYVTGSLTLYSTVLASTVGSLRFSNKLLSQVYGTGNTASPTYIGSIKYGTTLAGYLYGYLNASGCPYLYLSANTQGLSSKLYYTLTLCSLTLSNSRATYAATFSKSTPQWINKQQIQSEIIFESGYPQYLKVINTSAFGKPSNYSAINALHIYGEATSVSGDDFTIDTWYTDLNIALGGSYQMAIDDIVNASSFDYLDSWSISITAYNYHWLSAVAEYYTEL